MAGNKPPAVWAPEARADLSDIWTYYAEAAGPHTADRMIKTIAETCRMLEDHPIVGRARDEIRSDLRSILAHPYVIFYRIRNDIPQIVRVLHGRRDIDEIFSDEPESD